MSAPKPSCGPHFLRCKVSSTGTKNERGFPLPIRTAPNWISRTSSGTISDIVICTSFRIPPPPMPWTAQQVIYQFIFCVAPQRADVTRKMVMTEKINRCKKIFSLLQFFSQIAFLINLLFWNYAASKKINAQEKPKKSMLEFNMHYFDLCSHTNIMIL